MHAGAAHLEARRVEAVVIGGSAGAFEALRVAIESLPTGLDIPVVVTMHLPQRSPVELPHVLQPGARWPLSQAEDKEPLRGGHVYFAPPDYHLLIERERYLALSVDEPEYFSRPSIAALFESAADAYGAQLMGVLLSGASADGAAGLAAIHAAHGCTLVQDPESASSKTMPQAALDLFKPTWCLAPPAIGELFRSFKPIKTQSS